MATRTPEEARAARDAKLEEVHEQLRTQVERLVQATAEWARKVAVEILDQLGTVQISDGTPPGLTRDPATPARASEGKQTRSRPVRAGESQHALASHRGL